MERNNINPLENLYCNSLTKYTRLQSREVFIGEVPLGGNNPIRIQSMTTTNTMDTIATVEQTLRMVESGCEYVRITAPSINEAKNLAEIKRELHKRGCYVPLIADIHFTPNAAEAAARIVEKVRVNPGNYVDKKKFNIIEYDDKTYNEELDRIRQKFTPLVKICKEYGTAMRIGTNHGSLSDRIMSRYGDTPIGMVESALEFVRICEENNYNSIVLSMKSSNPQVMVQAYRLLVQKMIEEGMNYPLHLGVTEAGGGEDGRIKSALGIGTLLEDGLGDTIRVSLTEDPEFEAPVAKKIASRYINRSNNNIPEIKELTYSPYNYNRRETNAVGNVGGKNVPVVVSDFSSHKLIKIEDLKGIGYKYNSETDKWITDDIAADYIFIGEAKSEFELPLNLKVIDSNFMDITLNELNDSSIHLLTPDKILVLSARAENPFHELRRAFILLQEKGIKNPVVIKRTYKNIDKEQLMIDSSIEIGGLLIDGFGDGAWIKYDNDEKNNSRKFVKESNEIFANRLAFNLMQAARLRISKTEYIACPSCGRTLFDLQTTTDKIRQKTGHLKGVKIAVMGCIVNGPGEMADADYGYVGSGVGKITLYKSKNIVKSNIHEENAVDELINIIKEDGNWQEMMRVD